MTTSRDLLLNVRTLVPALVRVQRSGYLTKGWSEMSNHEVFALARRIEAVQLMNTVFVIAEGDKPNSCYAVWLERSRLDVEPPFFSLLQKYSPKDPGSACPQMVVPFVARARMDRIADKIIVRDRAGDHPIEVKQVRHPRAVLAEARGGGGQPDPLVKGFDLREGIGYSEAYSLAEAVSDALKHLPPGPPPRIADELAYFEITSMGVEIGGIAGVNHLRVVVRTYDVTPDVKKA